MSKYRSNLPLLNGNLFLTDGGIETTLIFHDKQDLPYFASFVLLESEEETAVLRKYFEKYAEVAAKQELGLVLESATWRANLDWATKLGYSPEALTAVHKKSIAILEEIRNKWQNGKPIVISGCVGPRSDGYNPEFQMTFEEAQKYHSQQIQTFSETEADVITAITMSYAEEAIGIVRAAKSFGMPAVISFTLEMDGKLPSGQTLQAAIQQVDEATDGWTAYYMINCAHPTHFDNVVAEDAVYLERIRGVRANASKRSHAELDEAPDLDAGNPMELGQQYAELKHRLKNLTVVGGCCGTDHRHIDEIGKACSPLFHN